MEDLSHFSSVEETGPVTVHLDNNWTCNTKQQGSVLLKLCSRHKGITRKSFVLIVKVMYITESAVNIMSCSELNKPRIPMRFDNSNC